MKKSYKVFLSGSFLSVLLFFAFPAQAVCPVCTVAVGACIGLAQYLGIDDSITGVWIGGLIISMIVWTINWMSRKKIHFLGRKILVSTGYVALVVGPLFWKDVIGHPFNKLFGIDKLLLGIITGGIFFILAIRLNDFLKERNGNKVFFPFQRVVVPILILGIISGIFYFLTC